MIFETFSYEAWSFGFACYKIQFNTKIRTFYYGSAAVMYLDMIPQYFLNQMLTILKYVEFNKKYVCKENYFTFKIVF